MTNKLGDLLLSSLNDMSPTMRVAAKWMIDHPDDVALLTMREQARRAGVPPATMTRLSQRLGFTGYGEIRHRQAEDLRARANGYSAQAKRLVERIQSDGSVALAQGIVTELRQHLQMLSTRGSLTDIAAAAESLIKARRVYVLGMRSCFSVAFLFHYLSTMVKDHVVLVEGPGGTAVDTLRDAGPEDALLVASMDPYAVATVEIANVASARGLKIVAVTDSPVSPVARLAAQRVLVPTITRSFFRSMTAACAVTEILVALLIAADQQTTYPALAECDAG
jgi:DNA-binding MurR/RpiR family transcriptional regulator